jgi:hypothetical protein
LTCSPICFFLVPFHFWVTPQVALQSLSSPSAAPAISSAFRDDSKHQTWSLLAATAAAGIAGGSLLTLCDQHCTQVEPNVTGTDKFQAAVTEQGNEESKSLQTPVIQATSRPVDPSLKISVTNEPVPVDMGPNPPEHRMSSAEAQLEEATRKAKQHSGGLKVFSGNGNMALALEIARHLGINLGKSTVGRFADGEVNVVIHENVRGKDVYIVQPTGPPVNDNIMELLLMVSTLRRASARRITVVIVSCSQVNVTIGVHTSKSHNSHL